MAEDKKDVGCWIFHSGDPELIRFCDTITDIDSLYCILYVGECATDYSAEVKELLCLHGGSFLFVDPLLIRVYAHLQMNGCFIIVSDSFFKIDQTRIFFNYFAFNKMPKGVLNIGSIFGDQMKCLALIEEEYNHSDDSFRPHILKNLMVGLLMLYFPKYTLHLRSGHLLDYAVRFVDLLKMYGVRERKKSFYANQIGITEKTLADMLEIVFGQPFRKIIAYKILNEATKRLVFNNQSVKQVALELDYDVSGFNKIFTKWRGMRPIDLQQHYHHIIHQI
ncbi:MAG: helix-turn-helix domain-containing protein [Tannerella sp.]|jgi:AraC-like DNA-binding protein|nr:helix-turn-helix domain-containing protein [Tannerella sp.]